MTLLNEKEKKIETSGIFYKYALVLVNVKNLGTRTFSYLIPEELKMDIKIGQPILVPFGTQGNINAFVVGFSNYLDEGIKAKSILEILDEDEIFNLDYLKFLEWAANYYSSDLNSVLQAAVPMKFLKQSKRIIKRVSDSIPENADKNTLNILNYLTSGKEVSLSYLQKNVKIPYAKFYTITRNLKRLGIVEILNILEDKTQKTQYEKYIEFVKKEGATKRQVVILEELEKLKETRLIDFEKHEKTTRATINKLVKEGFINIKEVKAYRNPLDILKVEELEPFPELNQEQKNAFKIISKKIDSKQTEPILLHGITASGKTEVYFEAIKKVIQNGKNVLFLAPEIALASQLTRRLAERFGTQDVALWHSSISDGEKYDVWQKLRKNEIKILAGARSSVFAPLKNIGLIIVDEEHESAYKQVNPEPRYNAVTVAKKIAELNNATIILGSATPDIESYYKAKNSGNLIEMTQRFNNSKIANVTVIDMRDEFNKGFNSIFSRSLLNAIEKNLKEKKQTLLLINRRGFANHIQCKSCGEIMKCPHCEIPLIYHKSDNTLKCHWCNHEITFPKTCKKCGSDSITATGLGTQRVEEVIAKIFANAKVARLDSDILTSKTKHIDVLDEFLSGDIDILVGTQMIAKGLDNKNVTLVGVINSDSSFTLPDYRAAERGFQLLTQVAGRSGRGDFEGKVYFQTYNPDFYAIETAKKQDYKSFYEEEISSREFFDFPPFSQLIKLVIHSQNKYRAEKSAQEIALRLTTITEKQGIQERLIVLGPTSCILEKINNEYRFQIIIKNKMDKKGHFFITSFLQKIKMPNDIKLIVDVDPIDII